MKKNPIVFILVDGMRPDGLLNAETPAMKKLFELGASTFAARTVSPSVTLPCILSIFLGVPPETHGTIGNLWNSGDWSADGLIDLFHSAGNVTASFFNWEQLRDISRPGSLDISICVNQSESPDLPLGESDQQITSIAISMILTKPYDFSFIYLGCTDTAGHRHGWMSPEYLHTLENADQCMAKILEVLPDHTRVIIASDHGGHDFTHGTEQDEDMIVPLCFWGEGIRPQELQNPVSVLDIAPTVASLAGLKYPREWMGKNLL